MCYFITGTLSPDGDAHAVRRIGQGLMIGWKPIENRSVLKQLRPGETYYLTTRGMCDCGTAIGLSARTPDDVAEPNYDRKVKKLQKKGWSQTKIDRWLADRRSLFEHRRRQLEEVQAGQFLEIERWLDFIRNVIDSKAATSVGILLHGYNGGLETEKIGIQERRFICKDDLTPQCLFAIEEDILYEFERS